MIAIVEDDESVRDATSGLMESYGLPVRTFTSAEEFLSSADTYSYSCLVADVHLPGMSGPELQEYLNVRARGLNIIFMTAFPSDGVRNQVIAAGASGFYSKPFNSVEMIEQIMSLIGYKTSSS